MVATELFPITFHNIIVSQHDALCGVKVLGRTEDVLLVLSLSATRMFLNGPLASPVILFFKHLEFELGNTFYVKNGYTSPKVLIA